MPQDLILLNDGTSHVLLNDGTSRLALNTQTAEPFVSASVTTGNVFTRTLHYMAFAVLVIAPPAPNTVTIDKWQQPLSVAVPRPPVFNASYTPFVPKEATRENRVTPDKWLRPFDVQPRRILPIDLKSQPFVPPPPPPAEFLYWTSGSSFALVKSLYYDDLSQPVVIPAAIPPVTPDKWLIQWPGPPRYLQGLPGGQPFVPKAAVLDNTVTPDNWLIAWQGPPRYLQPLPGGQPFVPKEAVLENTQTPDKWLQAWQGPPRYWPIKVQTPPFVPKAAVLDNTVTPDAWMQPFYKAAPNTKPVVTQPFYGFPYEAVDNTRNEWDWTIAWQGPPTYLQRLQPGSPFVPKEAVLENTVTPDKWIFSFQKAVLVPAVWPTQPFFEYPYSVAVNLTTTLEWLQAWQGPPRYLQNLPGGQPFVPKEAVRENTVTPDKWLISWQGPPRYWPIKVQALPFVPREAVLDNTVTPDAWLRPFDRPPPAPLKPTQLAFPFFTPDNTVTPDKWLQPLAKIPTKYTPPSIAAQPFVPKEAVLENTVTPDKWLEAWQGPPRYQPQNKPYSPFVPKEAVLENTVTPDAWLFRFTKYVPAPQPVITQPFFGYPYVVAPNLTTTLEWQPPLSRSVTLQWLTQYGGNTMPSFPYEGVVPPPPEAGIKEVWWPRTLEETYWHIGKKSLEIERERRELLAEEQEQRRELEKAVAEREKIRVAVERKEIRRAAVSARRKALTKEIGLLRGEIRGLERRLAELEIIRQTEDEEAIFLLMAEYLLRYYPFI